MRLNWNLIARSMFSGFILAIASTVNLLSDSRLAGAFLFSVGLTTIFALQAFLYTGAVGETVILHKPGWLPWLLVMLGGNLLGTLIAAPLMLSLQIGPSVAAAAAASWGRRLEQSAISAFVSSAFCGFLVYSAWKANTRGKDRPVLTTFVIVLCVMVFVLAGFEHSIANSFLMFVSGSFDGKSFLYLLLMILGNTVGAAVPAAAFCARSAGGS